METKSDIRRRIRSLRRAAGEEFLASASARITERIAALPEFAEAPCVLAYMDLPGEVRTEALIRLSWQLGKTVAVPRVVGADLVFQRIRDFSSLSAGSFGVREPDGSEPLAVTEGFLLVPGVAFDRARHRIGYGKGFYDRFLNAHPGLTAVAAAFDFQVLEDVPHDAWDIRPQLLVTESRVFCRERGVSHTEQKREDDSL